MTNAKCKIKNLSRAFFILHLAAAQPASALKNLDPAEPGALRAGQTVTVKNDADSIPVYVDVIVEP